MHLSTPHYIHGTVKENKSLPTSSHPHCPLHHKHVCNVALIANKISSKIRHECLVLTWMEISWYILSWNAETVDWRIILFEIYKVKISLSNTRAFILHEGFIHILTCTLALLTFINGFKWSAPSQLIRHNYVYFMQCICVCFNGSTNQ